VLDPTAVKNFTPNLNTINFMSRSPTELRDMVQVSPARRNPVPRTLMVPETRRAVAVQVEGQFATIQSANPKTQLFSAVIEHNAYRVALWLQKRSAESAPVEKTFQASKKR
jgi:hypothetical protein